MKILAITSLVAFAVSLPLRWWQNTWIGANDWETPRILHRSLNQLAFLVITFLLTYGSIVGIWYFLGVWPAVFAFALKWWVGRTSWNRTFKSEVKRAADHYYEQMLEAKLRGGKPRELGLSPKLPEDIATWGEEEMKREAYNLGQTSA